MSLLESRFTATIANGQQLSGAVDLLGFVLCGLHLPAALTGTAITFFASDTLAGTYREISTGSAYSVTVAADKYVPVDSTKFEGVRYLKIRSGSAEGGARTVTLSAKARR